MICPKTVVYTKPVTPSVEHAEEYGDSFDAGNGTSSRRVPDDKMLRPHSVLDSELPTVHPSAERSSLAVSVLICFLVVEWIN